MAVIYLRHPEFGSKVATMDAEAEYDKEHGYEEYDPVMGAAEVEDEVEIEEVAPVNKLQPKRRGRPPRQENAA